MKKINDKLLRDAAAEYGLSGQPVILFDKNRQSIYFNPAAAADSALPMGPEFLKELSARSMQYVLRCLRTKEKQVFTQAFGKHSKKTFIVTVKSTNTGFSLTFDSKEHRERSPLRPVDPDGSRTRSALHQLLAASDLMIHGQTTDVAARGKQCRKQTLRAIRIQRQLDLLDKEPECAVVKFSDLLELIVNEAQPYIGENRLGKLQFIAFGKSAHVKCCPIFIQHILYGSLAVMLEFTKGEILLQYAENPDQVMLTLTGEATTDADVSLHLYTAAELTRRQQGEFEILSGTDAQMTLRITLPTAHTEFALTDSLKECLEQNICIPDVEFSELI
ncbi:MAG: hypothetical protein IKY33_00960 [Clostridia bacterium]|nr:hypothetical protein [Clostridia bacterium]